MRKKSESYRGTAAQQLVTEVFENLAERPIKTAAAFRNTFMDSSQGMLIINPLLVEVGDSDVAVKGAMQLVFHARNAIADGRMIDFGFISNEVLKTESRRARPAFEAGELIHPYDGWFGVSWWEKGCNGYLVQPSSMANSVGVAEFYGVSLPGVDVVMLYDSMVIEPRPQDTRIYPAPMPVHGIPDKLRAANSLDPLVVMLRLLADASIPVSRVEAPDRLNAARAKAGKERIPPHSVVHTHDYVSQIAARASGRTQGDGTGRHASPIAHWRRSHLRRLANRVVQVRSSKVNWRSNEEIHRLFSKVTKKPEEGLTS